MGKKATTKNGKSKAKAETKPKAKGKEGTKKVKEKGTKKINLLSISEYSKQPVSEKTKQDIRTACAKFNINIEYDANVDSLTLKGEKQDIEVVDHFSDKLKKEKVKHSLNY